MGNTWIVDLRHYLTPAGAMADMLPRARLLAEYFASIVVDATTNIDEMPPCDAAGILGIADVRAS